MPLFACLSRSADESGSLRVWSFPAYSASPRPRLRCAVAVQAHAASVNRHGCAGARLATRVRGADASAPAVVLCSLSASDGGSLLASASDDGAVRLWDVAALGSDVPLSTLCAHGSFVATVAFAPDASPLLCSADLAGGVCVWDARSPGRPAQQLRVAAPAASAALPPGRAPLLLTACAGGAVQLWDLRALHPPAPTLQRLALAARQASAMWGDEPLSADDGSAACATPAALQTYRCDDVAPSCAFRHDTGRFEGRFYGHPPEWPPLLQAAFAGGGAAVLTSAADGTHRVWCAASGAGRRVVADTVPAPPAGAPPHAARPSLAAPPGSRAAMPLLLAGCPDGSARIWHLGAPPLPGGALAGVAVAPPACRLRDHAVAVRATALAPEGLALASADAAGCVVARRAGDAPPDDF